MDIQVEPVSSDPQARAAEPSAPAQDLSHMMIAQHFDVTSGDEQAENKLREIWELGKQLSQTGDPQDIMWQVLHLERTLGAPQMGELRLDKVYKWAKLKRQEAYIQSQLRGM